MDRPQPALAKLTRPALDHLLPRERLFDRIAQWHGRPVSWLGAPPGYGKTSLAAGYLARTRPASDVWYQLDADDGYAATFFYYLSLASSSHGQRGTADLPFFARELAADLPRFARTFFRQFYARLATPAVIVFDNVHELTGDGLAALAIGLGELPAGVTILALSREDPPAALARLEANRQIGWLHAQDFCFTDDEALALANHDGRLAERIRVLLPQLQGWPAGICLTLEHLSREDAIAGPPPGADREAIFRYFAFEVFDRAPPEIREVLLACALLPSVTDVQAGELSGSPHAGHVLEQLYRRRLFVDRRGGADAVYHFHSLFHEFLQAQLRQRWPAPVRRDLAVRCARLLAAAGRNDEAAQLFREAQEWPGLAALLVAQAGNMMNQGRASRWRSWLAWLPEGYRSSNSWLLYWDGIAQLRSAPDAARELLERAYTAFAGEGATRGCLQTAADIILFHYYERLEYRSLPQWLEALRSGAGGANPGTVQLTPDEHLRVQSALLIGLSYHRPDDPVLAHCVMRVRQALNGTASANGRIVAGTLLLQHFNFHEGGQYAQSLIALLEPVAAQPEVCAFVRISWQAQVAFNQYLVDDPAACEATAAAARRHADSFGLTHLMARLDRIAAAAQLAADRLDAARTTLDRLRLLSAPGPGLVDFDYLQIILRLRSGETAGLTARAQALVEASANTATTPLQTARCMALLAGCHLVEEQYEQAQHWFRQAAALDRGSNAARYEALRCFADAYRLLHTGHAPAATSALTAAFAEYKRLLWLPVLRALPGVLPTLCAAAVEAGVEIDHVQQLIAARGLPPPRYYLASWPWPVRMRLLGRFSLSIGGEEIAFRGKMQKRPLELLGALVASERGEETARLCNRLWPDADGASARAALDTTLHRLRKLLRLNSAVHLSGSHVGLDRDAVWADVWALAALAPDVRAVTAQTPKHEVEKLAEHLFDLYRGPFGSDHALTWAIAARDQCRERFVQCVAALASYWEARGQFMQAAALYTRAQRIEEGAEALYQGLIRCALAVHDPQGALRVYRQCAQILPRVIGTRPSAKTRQLVLPLLELDAAPGPL